MEPTCHKFIRPTCDLDTNVYFELSPILYPLSIFMPAILCFLGIYLLHACCPSMLDIHIHLAILLCHHPSSHSLLACLLPCHHVIQAVCIILVHEPYHLAHCLLCQVLFMLLCPCHFFHSHLCCHHIELLVLHTCLPCLPSSIHCLHVYVILSFIVSLSSLYFDLDLAISSCFKGLN